jgi:hypothetical protein
MNYPRRPLHGEERGLELGPRVGLAERESRDGRECKHARSLAALAHFLTHFAELGQVGEGALGLAAL